MESNLITLTIKELEDMLDDQKSKTAEYITRNLTVYGWYNANSNTVDLNLAKQQLKERCYKSDYPDDFNTLKKYLK